MDEYYKLKKKSKKNKNNKIYFWFLKLLFIVVITLLVMIMLKQNKDFQTWFNQNVYQNNFNFASINKTYKKYFGSSLPFKDFFKNQTKTVFEEKLKYEEDNLYLDGVKLTVDDNYLVPILDMGMVIFIGEKEGYGNTVIIEQSNGVEVWYGNIKEVNVQMYDLKEKGEYLGEVNGKELYLVFKKNGETLNYKEYLT